MFSQQQYHVDAQRRRDMEARAERERLAHECERQATPSVFAIARRWFANQSDRRPVGQTQTNPQIIMRRA